MRGWALLDPAPSWLCLLLPKMQCGQGFSQHENGRCVGEWLLGTWASGTKDGAAGTREPQGLCVAPSRHRRSQGATGSSSQPTSFCLQTPTSARSSPSCVPGTSPCASTPTAGTAAAATSAAAGASSPTRTARLAWVSEGGHQPPPALERCPRTVLHPPMVLCPCPGPSHLLHPAGHLPHHPHPSSVAARLRARWSHASQPSCH